VGANVQPGQDVVVTCLVEHAEIARAMARESYRAGAKHVVVLYSDLHLRHAAIELGPEEELGWSAPYLLDWVRRWDRENPAVISLTGNPDPDLLTDLDPGLVGRAEPKEFRRATLEGVGADINWVIVAAPNEGWATQVFGEPDVERLGRRGHRRRSSTNSIRGAWRAHARLQSRADDESRSGDRPLPRSGTDLTVGLVPAD
jgi:aminopeptidase